MAVVITEWNAIPDGCFHHHQLTQEKGANLESPRDHRQRNEQKTRYPASLDYQNNRTPRKSSLYIHHNIDFLLPPAARVWSRALKLHVGQKFSLSVRHV